MKYENFEDLPVWNDAIALAAEIFRITEDKAFRFKGDIANQIQRAGLSVSNNIAEGFERGTTSDLITFLYYAKGSAGEVRSVCHVMNRLPYFRHLKSDISDLISKARDISRQLGGWAFSMQESDIAGTRHLTEQSRDSYRSKKNAEGLLSQIRANHEKFVEELVRQRNKDASRQEDSRS